jgi:dynein light intermediate chain
MEPSLAVGQETLPSLGSSMSFQQSTNIYDNNDGMIINNDDRVTNVLGGDRQSGVNSSGVIGGPDIPFSLVQRDPPLLMGDGKGGQTPYEQVQQISIRQQQRQQQPDLSGDRVPSSAETIEILHTLLPPITLNDQDGRVWKQYCSTPMANRNDVYRLQDALDVELIERQARPYGICPVRELLYSQAFDELLRQVALESPERGLMMLRVRDQLRMTIACYQTLFHNSTNFGMKRAVMGENRLLPYTTKINELIEKKKKLKAKVYDLKDKLRIVEEYETDESEIQRKAFRVETSFLEDQIQQLRSFLRTTGVQIDEE